MAMYVRCFTPHHLPQTKLGKGIIQCKTAKCNGKIEQIFELNNKHKGRP